ncbi:DNA-directed RNA polymerase subunit beta [Solibacillus sp. FSL R5-0691]|uniref:DNA-directed RNA polymerase subunit beta n=1 Tax=Solibacillus sp. FSL R5-0691 TaxID=2921653 RepID=UPI0030D2802C
MTNDFETQTEQKEPAAKKTRRRVKNVSEPTTTDQPVGKVRLRLIPIWLRIIIVILLFLVAVILGLVIGYSVLGDGAASDVLKWETWQHLLDIINGKE